MSSLNSMRVVTVCLVATGLCVLMQLGSISIGSDQESKPRMVHHSDILEERVQIIGKLGEPLGQLVTVRGHWESNLAKPSPPFFIVNRVNGRPLDPPAIFDEVDAVWKKIDAEITKKTLGLEWELRGVETGGFVGFSDKVWEELEEQLSQKPPRGFLTRFYFVKANRISSSKPTDSGKE